MIEKIIPKNDRVLVKPIEDEELQYGNIIVPDMGKEKPEMAEVIAVGTGRMSEFGTFIPTTSRVGDIVIVPKIGTIRVTVKGEEYYVVQDREILAIVIKSEEENKDEE